MPTGAQGVQPVEGSGSPVHRGTYICAGKKFGPLVGRWRRFSGYRYATVATNWEQALLFAATGTDSVAEMNSPEKLPHGEYRYVGTMDAGDAHLRQ
jgi:hypothetical protein